MGTEGDVFSVYAVLFNITGNPLAICTTPKIND